MDASRLKNRERNFFVKIIVSIILLTLFFVVSFLIFPKQKTIKEGPPSQPEVADALLNSDHLQVYKNTLYGYEFKYNMDGEIKHISSMAGSDGSISQADTIGYEYSKDKLIRIQVLPLSGKWVVKPEILDKINIGEKTFFYVEMSAPCNYLYYGSDIVLCFYVRATPEELLRDEVFSSFLGSIKIDEQY